MFIVQISQALIYVGVGVFLSTKHIKADYISIRDTHVLCVYTTCLPNNVKS